MYFPGLEPIQEEPIKAQTMQVAAHEKTKRTLITSNAISFPNDLPVEEYILDLSEEEKIDPSTGTPLLDFMRF
ncbi:MAG: hypothetical protein FJZ58_01850 [Chlamydiae bacterium]|nr:hypothetical protein [Chlamydiota bacterium]